MAFKPRRFGFHKFTARVIRADDSLDARPSAGSNSDDAAADDAAIGDTREIDMSFADQLELPDELALLAEQLGADAEFLAARHPADAAERLVRPVVAAGESQEALRQSGSRERLAWLSVAAMVLIAAGTWGVLHQFESAGPGPVLTADANRPAAGQPTLTADHDSANSPATPAMFFQDLSGPEQEGLLDLLEEEQLPQSSLSI